MKDVVKRLKSNKRNLCAIDTIFKNAYMDEKSINAGFEKEDFICISSPLKIEEEDEENPGSEEEHKIKTFRCDEEDQLTDEEEESDESDC